jgi:transcriptional regulator with XRE-family HTH domain
MTDHDLKLAARRLTEARHAKGLSQAEVADLAGINRATLHSYESATRAAKIGVYKTLAEIYETTPAYLAGFTTQVNDESLYSYPAKSSGNFLGKTPENELVAFHRNLLDKQNINPMNCILIQCPDDFCYTQIKAGDYAIVDSSKTIPDRPALFAVQDRDNLILRWARRETGANSFIIYADEEKHFPPFKIIEGDDQTVKILGKVIGIISWPGL